LPAHLQAVDPGQPEIEHHHIGIDLARHRQRFGAAVTHRHLEILADQVAGDHIGQRRLVIDHQRPVALVGCGGSAAGDRIHAFIVPCAAARSRS